MREGTTRPGQQQASIAASSAEAAASSPAGQQPRQPASPPPPSPYARPRGVSSPAAAATAAAATGAYGRATTASADGYRQTQNQQPQPQQRVGTVPSGSDAAGSNTMGMIPGYTVSTLLGEGGFCQVTPPPPSPVSPSLTFHPGAPSLSPSRPWSLAPFPTLTGFSHDCVEVHCQCLRH